MRLTILPNSLLLFAAVIPSASPAQVPTSNASSARHTHAGRPCGCGVEGGFHVTADPNDFNLGSYLWVPTAYGDPSGLGRPMRLTWGFAVDQSPIDPAPGFGVAPGVRSNLLATFGPTQLQTIRAAIAEWSAVCGVELIEITTPSAGAVGASGPNGSLAGGVPDIRIGGAALLPSAATGGIDYVGFAYPPAGGGDVVLDTSDPRSITNVDFLRNSVVHELGHALGLGHVCPENGTKIMEQWISTTARTPLSQDDILGAQMIYGDPFEVLSSVPGMPLLLDDAPQATAPRFFALRAGQPVVRTGHSVDPADRLLANLDVDYFAVTVSTPGRVRVTVTPVGVQDFVGAQPPGGCTANSASFVYPNVAGDLAVTVTGAAPVESAPATGFGGTEVVEFPLSPGQLAQVAVNAYFGPVGGSPGPVIMPQQYTISAELFPMPAACQSGQVLDVAGTLEDSLSIDNTFLGRARTAVIPQNQGFTLRVSRPTVNPSPAGFVLWINTTVPLGPAFPLGFPYGTMCFDPIGPDPARVLLADTSGLWGPPLYTGLAAAAPTTLLPIPPLSSALSLSVQGLIEVAPGQPRVTNAIVLHVR